MEEKPDVSVLFFDASAQHTFSIEEAGETWEFTIKLLSPEEIDEIGSSGVSINAKTKEMKIDNTKSTLNYILKSLVKAPFPVNEMNVRRLKYSVRKKLSEEITEFNELGDDIIKN